MSAASTPLLARYHGNGVGGHKIPNPYLCPVTAYCPEGSADATACPNGKWTPSVGAISAQDCIPCKRGYFCNFFSMRSHSSFAAFKSAYPAFTMTQLENNFASIATYYG
mmetsp:Transcript_32591/g.40401  ORF Transcript_32591/g.40401 Transcript_32591/m.40401 type:complete len:109 (+) Transcript_32591:415-741(+)